MKWFSYIVVCLDCYMKLVNPALSYLGHSRQRAFDFVNWDRVCSFIEGFHCMKERQREGESVGERLLAAGVGRSFPSHCLASPCCHLLKMALLAGRRGLYGSLSDEM